MPYILPEKRDQLDPILEQLSKKLEEMGCVGGDLNYTINKLADHYITVRGLRYQHLEAVMGTLESSKAEFYRRVVAPYEDTAIEKNGDCYKNINKGNK